MFNSTYDFNSADSAARTLLATMTIEEKLGQLNQLSGDVVTGPDNIRIDRGELAAKGGIGSALNIRGAKETNELQRRAVEESRLRIPILFGLDIIHGLRTVYPIPLAIAATWNPDIAHQCAHVAAVEARSEGIRWTFSPMVDIGRDSRWGRVTEGNGEDPYLGSAMSAAWVRGYQGDSLSGPNSILACAKHFIGYGGAEGGREYELVDISERVLRDIYLPPFQAAVDAGVATIMSAFNTLQGVPASANHWTLTRILREEWGFMGFIVSDWDSIGELISHGVALDGADAAFKALTAGVDMDMQSNLYASKCAALVESGRLSIDTVDQAVFRILRIKFAMGLFDQPYTEEKRIPTNGPSQAFLDIAKKAAEESFVLLKNDHVDGRPLLPLLEGQKIALIGPLADSKEDMFGAWASGDEPETLRETLSRKLGGKLLYANGVEVQGGTKDGFAEAFDAAASSDIVLLTLGERGNMSGEANSRSIIDLPGHQIELLRKLGETGRPIVILLFSGRPLALPVEIAVNPAVLQVWFPGVQAGPAITDVLFGDSCPSGRLAASFPRSTGQMPLYYNTLNTGRPALGKEPGDGFLTGYVDEYNTALFPFGWGLSYTTFRYSPTEIVSPEPSAKDLNLDGSIKIRARLQNTGTVEAAEVAQLYIRQRGTSVARPIRELKGFRKLSLAPGETSTVEFNLTKKELAFWNIDMEHKVEPGELTVWIAPNSISGSPAVITITD